MTTPPTRAWLFTFADLAALLLAFFVLAYSMTALDRETWRRVSGTLASDAAGSSPAAHAPPPGLTAEGPAAAGPERLDYLAGVLARELEQSGRPCGLAAALRRGQLVVDLGTFPAGLDDPVCRSALRRVGEVVARLVAGRPEVAAIERPASVPSDPGAALSTAWTTAELAQRALGVPLPVLVLLGSEVAAGPTLRVGPL